MNPKFKFILLTTVPIVFFVLGILVRIGGINLISGDMHFFLLPWYDEFVARGFYGLGDNFSNYTPPYLYLLALATLTRSLLPKVVGIKLFSILFDILNSVLIYKIIKLKYPSGKTPILASAVFWLAPTIFLNSSVWGQADGIYTFFLLYTLYFFIQDRPFAAMLTYGITLSIKVQGVFLAPFLILLTLKKRLPWYYFGILPIVYLLMMVPAILLGRPVMEVLTVYLSQASYYTKLSMRAPNLYSFVPESASSIILAVGLIITLCILAAWIYFYARRKLEFRPDSMIFFALVSVAIVPFFMPKMHDRYFYPADVLSLIMAFFNYNLWFIPLLYQIVSGLVYFNFLFAAPDILIKIAAIINTLTVCYLLWKQYQRFGRDSTSIGDGQFQKIDPENMKTAKMQ